MFPPVEWLNVRKHQISAESIFERQNQAWRELLEDGSEWVKLERVYGLGNVKNAYDRVMKGGFRPDQGYIWSLWDSEGEVDAEVVRRLSGKL
jgi:hypothetical protein